MAAGKFNVLFSDLDGTLIFSASRKKVGDIVIERKDGAEISCVTARQAELLPNIGNIVPVTTRSIEQYRRIEFPGGVAPEYALCDNGGTLLINGETDGPWLERSAEIFREAMDEISRFRTILERDPDRRFEVRFVDGFFLFTKSANPNLTLARLGVGERCECFATGEKVYVIPKRLNKGAAVERLAELIGITRENIFCAGDSLMDVPMLNAANTALFTDDIPEDMITANNKRPHKREGFTEFVTETAMSISEQ
ncbi:MAG: HAD hydrolase family protein [Ruminococcaceae bacterium]|nr:HAD hydrolase family protein [Oscillospiraceae bacterium]